jgi:WD40 repeat protein
MMWSSRARHLVVVVVCACLLVLAAVLAFRASHARSASPPAPSLSPSRIASVSAPIPVEAVAFSPDRTTVAVRLVDGSVQLRDTTGGAVRASLSEGKVMDSFPGPVVAFSPDGKTLAAGVGSDVGAASRVDLWDVATRRVTATFAIAVPEVYSVVFSPDGGTIAVGGGTFLVLCDVANHSSVSIPDNEVSYQGDAEYVSYSADGRTLAVADNRGVIRLWDIRSARFTRSMTLKPSASGQDNADMVVDASVISPDGKTVATVGSPVQDSGPDGATPSLWLWHTDTGTVVRPAATEDVSAVAYSPDGALLATGDRTGRTMLWSTATDRPLVTMRSESDQEAVRSVAFSRDGRMLATSQSVGYQQQGPNTVQWWNLYGPT